MTIAEEPGIPFHRLAHTPEHRWWRPLVGTLLIVGIGIAADYVVVRLGEWAGELAGRPANAAGWHSFGDAADTGLLLLGLAVLLPCVLLIARWVQRRPAGTVASVVGRLRWGWLGRCALLAAPSLVLTVCLGGILPGSQDEAAQEPLHWVGAGPFLSAAVPLAVLVLFQASAEEFLFRGWLLQAAGTYVRSPWLPIGVQAALFAAAHGFGTGWGLADGLLFGGVLGWLAVRTGGLEAGIAMHVVTNVAGVSLAAAVGQLGSAQTVADATWQQFVANLAVLPAYAMWISQLADRRKLVTRAPADATVGV